MRFTQMVLVQKIENDFDLPEGKAPCTLVVAGQELPREDGSKKLGVIETSKPRSGAALLVHMVQ